MFCSFCGSNNAELYTFCSSCGKQKVEPESDSVKIEKSNTRDSLTLLCETINCYFDGPDYTEIHRDIGESFDQKNALNIVYNIYLSTNHVIALPVSKDKSNLKLFGMAFGVGALSVIAMAAFNGLAKKLEGKNAKFVLDKDDPFYNAIFFDKSEIQISVKEIKSQTGDLIDYLFRKETWFHISGVGIYKNKEFKISMKFGHDGSSEKSKEYKILVTTLNIKPPKIYKNKPFPF